MSLTESSFKRALLWALLLIATVAEAKTQLTRKSWGRLADGTAVEIYALRNGKIEAAITTYGGIVVSLQVPDRKGNMDDVVLGYDSLSQYVSNNPYFGAIVGRYANRIAHGSFLLEGKTYSVPKNNGDNSLHGGTRGFDKVVWKAKPIKDGIELSYVSRDGEQGYPGTLTATVRYTLNDDGLRIEYSATTNKPTVVNLTNHSYFNLAGQGKVTILQQQLKIHASRFTLVDSTLIPTGELRSVEGTAIACSTLSCTPVRCRAVIRPQATRVSVTCASINSSFITAPEQIPFLLAHAAPHAVHLTCPQRERQAFWPDLAQCADFLCLRYLLQGRAGQ